MKYLIFISLFLLPANSFAARLYFEPTNANTKTGTEFRTDLFLDPQGEELNALDLELEYPNNLLFIRGIPTNLSVVSLWVKAPEASDGHIEMAGIMPGGFSGIISPETDSVGPGVVASFIFLPKAEGSSTFSITRAKIIKNDGKATPAEVKLSTQKIYIATSSLNSIPYDYVDTIEPAIFEPKIIKSAHLYGGKYALIFNTEDEGSGVDHYEVREGEAMFTRAVSPYILKDQSLGVKIYVRAIDVAGNERTVEINPKGVDVVSDYFSLSLLVTLAVMLFVLIIWKIRKKHSL